MATKTTVPAITIERVIARLEINGKTMDIVHCNSDCPCNYDEQNCTISSASVQGDAGYEIPEGCPCKRVKQTFTLTKEEVL